MTMPDLSGLADWVVVFDLDDTLYQENEYNRSGVIAVANEVEILYGKKNFKNPSLILKRNNNLNE